MLSAFHEPGTRVYRAFALWTRTPWYIVTAYGAEGRRRHLQSTCCSWNSDLIALLKHVPAERLVSIQQVVPASVGRHGWSTRDIQAVWAHGDSDGDLPDLTFEGPDGREIGVRPGRSLPPVSRRLVARIAAPPGRTLN